MTTNNKVKSTKKSKKPVPAVLASEKCLAKDYNKSKNDIVSLKAKDKKYIPSESVYAAMSIQMPFRNIAHVNCGFILDLHPCDLKPVFSLSETLLNKGVLLLNAIYGENKETTLTIINLGREIIMIKDGDAIGKMGFSLRCELTPILNTEIME